MDERFVRKYKQGTVSVIEIWVDRVTGVNYLYREDGSSGGLTVLVDADGDPVVDLDIGEKGFMG
ncbi:MAG: xylan 1,4-beta-xylosidase [Oscillospiraceae bacterium]|nr:xylan 1,4-beta-xylosidase [Oscillospiraceae bacterium]